MKNLAKYEQHLKEEEKSQATVDKYLRDVRAFFAFLEAKEITKEGLLNYKRHLEGNYKIRSANSMIASINHYLDYRRMARWKLKRLRMQREVFCREEKELTKGEYQRLLRAAEDPNNRRLYHVIQTIAGTGIRVSELPFITVEAVKAGRAEIHCKGKVRVILLSKDVQKLLKGYIKEEHVRQGSIFTTRTGRPLDRSNIWADMKRLAKEAKVPQEKVFPHNLRHLFARTFYQLDKDITRLADILGHSSIETTRLYIVSSGREHIRQINRMQLIS